MSEIKSAASAYQLFQRAKYGEVKAALEVRKKRGAHSTQSEMYTLRFVPSGRRCDANVISAVSG